MEALREEFPATIEFHGVGGHRMETGGLRSLFPMSEISLMGFLEIVPHIPRLLRRIHQTAEEIRHLQPDLVVTIDSPGFNFRVAEALQGSGIRLVHYVAPTVWAYKPERAARVARLYEHLLVLLPFEPPYFEKEGLPCTFVGHPIVEEDLTGGKPEALLSLGLSVEEPVVCVYPGSRRSELKRLLPVFGAALDLLGTRHPSLTAVAVSVPHLQREIEKQVRGWPTPTAVVSDPQGKKNALAAATAALAKSGTGTLEIAMAGIPMVIAYRANPLSMRIVRKTLRIRYANLINLILDREVIPEFLQEDCRPETLADGMDRILRDGSIRRQQRDGALQALTSLGLGSTDRPSRRAARVLTELLGTHRPGP
jgi:lipid-A-disaccharide synthase